MKKIGLVVLLVFGLQTAVQATEGMWIPSLIDMLF